MRLADRHPRKRKEDVRLAAEIALRAASGPVSTAELVGLLAKALDTKETNLIARTLVDIAPTHPQASQTGETFERFGRTMRRWEWSPPPKRKPSGMSLAERKAAQQAAEADDEWTVQPANPGGYVEDEE